MKALYYTTCTCSTVVNSFWYHSKEEYGNLIYDDGTSIKDHINKDPEKPEIPDESEDVVLATSTDKCILTSNNLKIALNI